LNLKNFALIGAAGYIAPRHLKAIKETNNKLVAAMDIHDSVGVIDSFFPESDFFTEFERFDRHIDLLRRQGEARKVDFITICSPNYLHDSHIRFGLRAGANVICEKPLVLNPWNIKALEQIEIETGKKVFTVLQLRTHTVIKNLREKYADLTKYKVDVDLTYITARGKWYFYSWKGKEDKSGGIASNIGVHFFDMLSFLFGNVEKIVVNYANDKKVGGFCEFERARVRWFLSIDEADLPLELAQNGQRTYRSILIDGQEQEFSEGFTDLHTVVYKDILSGKGYGLNDALPSIEIVSQIRNLMPIGMMGDYHPILNKFKK